jgi:hypothetical protein
MKLAAILVLVTSFAYFNPNPSIGSQFTIMGGIKEKTHIPAIAINSWRSFHVITKGSRKG